MSDNPLRYFDVTIEVNNSVLPKVLGIAVRTKPTAISAEFKAEGGSIHDVLRALTVMAGEFENAVEAEDLLLWSN